MSGHNVSGHNVKNFTGEEVRLWTRTLGRDGNPCSGMVVFPPDGHIRWVTRTEEAGEFAGHSGVFGYGELKQVRVKRIGIETVFVQEDGSLSEPVNKGWPGECLEPDLPFGEGVVVMVPDDVRIFLQRRNSLRSSGFNYALCSPHNVVWRNGYYAFDELNVGVK